MQRVSDEELKQEIDYSDPRDKRWDACRDLRDARARIAELEGALESLRAGIHSFTKCDPDEIDGFASYLQKQILSALHGEPRADSSR